MTESPVPVNRCGLQPRRAEEISNKPGGRLDALPDFNCRPGPGPHLRGAISISPSVEYMEGAYDDAKYGRFSRRPYIDIVGLGAIPHADPQPLYMWVRHAPRRRHHGSFRPECGEENPQ